MIKERHVTDKYQLKPIDKQVIISYEQGPFYDEVEASSMADDFFYMWKFEPATQMQLVRCDLIVNNILDKMVKVKS